MTTGFLPNIELLWLSSPELDVDGDPIVLCSSIRKKRNIDGFPFPNMCTKPQLYDVAALILGEIGNSGLWGACDFSMIDNLDLFSKNLLLEARLITQLMANGGPGRFFLRSESNIARCMINEEDHISVSVTKSGLSLRSLSETIESYLEPIKLKMAYDTVLGHLTANPNNVGSGAKFMVHLHLPALDALNDIKRVILMLERDWKGLVLYKYLSELNSTSGSYYLISNKVTLGSSDEDTVELVMDAALSLISKEKYARRKILKNIRNGDMKDRFWRAWGLLRHAHKLSFTEAINKHSFVKLGSDLGILPKIGEREWRSLNVGAQKYHIRALNEQVGEQLDDATARATIFRQFIEKWSDASPVPPSDLNEEL